MGRANWESLEEAQVRDLSREVNPVMFPRNTEREKKKTLLLGGLVGSSVLCVPLGKSVNIA